MGFCYQKNFSNPTMPVDEAQFYALVRAGKWNESIDKYRETGDAALKRKLHHRKERWVHGASKLQPN